MRVWLDDVRVPPDHTWTWVKTAHDARCALLKGGVVEISLDHDLSDEHYAAEMYDPHAYAAIRQNFKNETGYDVVLFMRQYNLWPEVIRVHTMNPAGRHAMEQIINLHAPGRLHPQLPFRTSGWET